MNRATPKIREFAARLIEFEAKERPSGALPAAVRVCERLRPNLATLTGKAGFVALLSRALALASREVPSPRDVRVDADGRFEGWDDLATRLSPEEIARGGSVLITHMLGLLEAFVGESLTLRLVADAWPTVSLRGFQSSNGESRAKDK